MPSVLAFLVLFLATQAWSLPPPIMSDWDKFPLRKTLEEIRDLPVSVNNDAELCALGKWAYSAGRDEQ